MAVAGLQLAHDVTLERSKISQEEAEFGREVQLLVRLPDGSDTQIAARMGYTVQHLKALLHKEHGLPLKMGFESTDGRMLLDPLSLSDCRILTTDATNVLIVKVG